jgi:DNA ligase (NAD+)
MSIRHRDFKKHLPTKFKTLRELKKNEAREQAEALRKEIEYHNYLYFVKNKPQISDALYDRLFRRLQKLEKKFPELQTDSSPTRRVGGEPPKNRLPVEHAAPMLSLHAAADKAEVARFDAFIRNHCLGERIAYFLEPKFDGVSVELVYEGGEFRRAATRGDGQRGDDVSENLKASNDFVPRLPRSKNVPAFLSVRGEAYLSRKVFQQINKERLLENLETFANPRNAAAGILHRRDYRLTVRWPVEIVVYDILRVEGIDLTTQQEVWRQLDKWGFKNSQPAKWADSLDGVYSFHKRLEHARDKLSFEIDGIVIKLDDRLAAERLGMRHRSPRGALAWKFAPREEVTVLEDIVVQVGKSGALTPVALLSPVDVGGVTICRATLHNEQEVRRKDLRVGDKVRIKRAGDVIPEVTERVGPARGRRNSRFSMPKKCPVCGTPIVQEGANWHCPAGITCPGQLVCCLTHLASREALDIEGLGEETARQLVDRELVKDVADIFDLTVENLQSLTGFATDSATKLYESIQAAKQPRLDRFLYGLAIRHVGQRTARLLAQEFLSLGKLRAASEDQIAGVAGAVVARSVRQFFDNRDNMRIMKRLAKSGVIAQGMPLLKSRQGLKGKTFVFTGTLSRFTRDEAKEAVEALGGRAASSVSRNTDYLVVGANPGSKLTDANESKIKIIDESAFRQLLGEATKTRRQPAFRS